MNPQLEQHRADIDALCRKYQVRRLELFGSAATGEFDANQSDYDFFVEFEDRGWRGSFKRYMGLKLDLEDLLGRPVDLVEPQTVTNPYFAQVANQQKRLIYAAA